MTEPKPTAADELLKSIVSKVNMVDLETNKYLTEDEAVSQIEAWHNQQMLTVLQELRNQADFENYDIDRKLGKVDVSAIDEVMKRYQNE